MGGEVALISSVIGLMTGMSKPDGPKDNSAQIAAERAAKEEEQRKREADERRREREKVTEARSLEQKRMAAKPKTTLANGAAGLANDPTVATAGLKKKLGE